MKTDLKKLYFQYLAFFTVTRGHELFHAGKILELKRPTHYPSNVIAKKEDIFTHITDHCTDSDMIKLFNSTESPMNNAHDPYYSHMFFRKHFSNGYKHFWPMTTHELSDLKKQAA
jgi:hypothetical protein